jgi:RHS repeat-associated protein
MNLCGSFHYIYNSANQRTQRTELDSSQWKYLYDTLGQVKSAKKYWASTVPVAGQQFTYAYDDIGNRTTTTGGGNETGANLRSATYTANSLNEYLTRDVPSYLDILGMALAGDTVTVNVQSTYRSEQYFRKELSVANGSAPLWQSVTVASTGVPSATGYRFVAQTPEAFTYDLDGDLMQDGQWAYTWDAENRLVKVESLSSSPTASKRRVMWEYDCRGRRIRQTTYDGSSGSYVVTEDLKFVSDGWNLVAELAAANNTVVRSYVWGLDISGTSQGAGGVGGLLAMSYHGSATTNAFVAYDGNGNVAALVNAADGSLVAKYEYAAFGELLRASGSMANVNPIRFSTKYQDGQCDLLYYGFRYYNPITGRWVSRDPIEEVGGINLYDFAANDLINRLDAIGFDGVATIAAPPTVWQGPYLNSPGGVPTPAQNPVEIPSSPQIGITPAAPNTVMLPFLAPYAVPENQALMARGRWRQLTGEDYADYAPGSLLGHDPSNEAEARNLLAAAAVKDKANLQCACKKLTMDESGWVFYFPMNNGRATAVVGRIDARFAEKYKNEDRAVTPKDFDKLPSPRDRGHLLAKSLGGTGRSRRNIVPMTLDFNRSVWPVSVENPLRNAISSGRTVCFALSVGYPDSNIGIPNRFNYFFKTDGSDGPTGGSLPHP